MRKLLCGLAAGAGLCAAAAQAPANASIILTLAADPVQVAGGYDYTYLATLSSDQQLDPQQTGLNGSFFTLYDFGNASLVSDDLKNAASWNLVLNQNQIIPAQAISPNNSSAVADVRAYYSGPRILTKAIGTTIGNLGTFTLFTTYTGPFATVLNNQDAQLDKYSPGSPTNDTITSNVAAVAVPSLGRAVPEPASLALLGAGLMGLTLLRRKAGQGA